MRRKAPFHPTMAGFRGVSDDSSEEGPEDVSRRDVAAMALGTLGLLGLASCVASGDDKPQSTIQSALSTAVHYAANYTALRATPGSPTQPVAVVGGYATANDGGGGVFYWSISTLVDNNGTIIKPTTGSGAWVRVFAGAINVRWFGAGLGAADDSGAIQAAIDVAIHNGLVYGSTVYFPAGGYNLTSPVYLDTPNQMFPGFISVRLVGDGKYNTHIVKTGPDATSIVVGGPDIPGRRSATRIRYCEISNLAFRSANPQTTGSTISFPWPGGIGVLIKDVYFANIYRCIECSILPDQGFFNAVWINNVHTDGITKIGIYARFALNWVVTDSVFNMTDAHEFDTYAIWLDSLCQGWMFDNVFAGHGDACLRCTDNFGTGRPVEDCQFHACSFDNGGRACIWATALHRSIFDGCWVATQTPSPTGCVVFDGPSVRAVTWTNSILSLSRGHGFWITGAESFQILNSQFNGWGEAAPNTYWAITIAGGPLPSSGRMNFNISNNIFYDDAEHPQANPWRAVNITGYHNRYIVTNNMTYGMNGIGTLTGCVSDLGVANYGKHVANNL